MIAAQLHLIHGGGIAFDVDGDGAGPPLSGTDDTAPRCGQHDPKHQSCDQDAPNGSHGSSLGSGSAQREQGYDVEEQRHGVDAFQMDNFQRHASRIASRGSLWQRCIRPQTELSPVSVVKSTCAWDRTHVVQLTAQRLLRRIVRAWWTAARATALAASLTAWILYQCLSKGLRSSSPRGCGLKNNRGLRKRRT